MFIVTMSYIRMNKWFFVVIHGSPYEISWIHNIELLQSLVSVAADGGEK